MESEKPENDGGYVNDIFEFKTTWNSFELDSLLCKLKNKRKIRTRLDEIKQFGRKDAYKFQYWYFGQKQKHFCRKGAYIFYCDILLIDVIVINKNSYLE